MHTDKKLTKEDTWRPADLRRYIKEEERGGGHVRRRDDYDRKHRGGESTERRNRDPEKDSRREKERIREGESTRERRDEEKKDRKIEGSQDRRADRESYRRDEREREKKREKERLVDGSKYGNDYRENKDRRRDREEKHDRERNKERHREKEKERARDSDRYKEADRNKTREYGDKERKREEQAREHRPDRDRRRHEENWEGRSNRIEKHHRQEKDRHREKEGRKNEFEDKRNDKEERRGDRKHSEQKEDREYKEEHRKHKEERERRHTERGHRDEKQKHDSEFRVHRGDEIRHHRADRERADRDKHKDRRYKEEEDPERKHRERRHKDEGDVERKHKERRHRGEEDQKDKRSSSDKSQVPERNVVQTEQVDMVSEHWIAAVKHEGDTEEPVVNDEDLANQEYEDDFEDYEEDFEELNESTNEDEDEKEPLHLASPVQAGEAKEELSAQERKEMEAIQRAMDEENERVGTAQSRQSTRREEERPKWSKDTETIQSRASQRGRFIDFVAAKQREVSKKVADKQKKRSTELLRLIDLDFSMTFSLLDLPPVNEYDMYIRNFGKANTKQAYVQCNEDNADRDIQTEEIEMSEKWTQHPPEHSGVCGDPNFSQESQDQYRSEMNFDSQRLASFLCSASQVMIVLLEEDQTSRKSLQKLSTQSDIKSFSDGSLQLNTKLPFLYGRQISMLHFSQVQKYTMMSVHMPRTEPSVMALDSCTIICIWNIWEPSRPQRILVYESEIQCCCFSPGKATMVFAGTSVGSVVLWDLREQASNHNRLKMGEEEWTFREPTFSTDSVMAASSHFSSVTSVEVVPSALTGELRPDIPLLASEEESSGLSFQLASLDESGVLNFWVVVELPKADEAGSPTDLGLRPGGKVKLLHSSSHPAAERGSPRGVVKMGPLQTLLLKFLPTDSNHFFIGTNMGLVHHGTSHGLKAPPKFYQFQEVEVQPVDVTSIHFSLFRPHLFLVGCGNGSIRLHAVSHDQPVAQWKNSTAGEPVVSLQWAQTRPTVFCVLDAASNLHIWDLLKNDTQPVVTENMNSDRVTAMAVFGDVGKQNTYSGVALAHESGKIEMQYFKRSLTVSCSAEEEKLLERMMTEAF